MTCSHDVEVEMTCIGDAVRTFMCSECGRERMEPWSGLMVLGGVGEDH